MKFQWILRLDCKGYSTLKGLGIGEPGKPKIFEMMVTFKYICICVLCHHYTGFYAILFLLKYLYLHLFKNL